MIKPLNIGVWSTALTLPIALFLNIFLGLLICITGTTFLIISIFKNFKENKWLIISTLVLNLLSLIILGLLSWFLIMMIIYDIN